MNNENNLKVEEISEIPVMVTLQEAAARTGLKYCYLRNLCLQNKIVYCKSGCKYLVNLGRLIDFLNEGEQHDPGERQR